MITQEKILLEYEGPYHFVKDQYYMCGEYDNSFTNFNKLRITDDLPFLLDQKVLV
jgi:hypothetical protein